MTADSHDPTLTSLEYDLGVTYWSKVWASDDHDDVAHAQRWLVSQLDGPRALWVARETMPINLANRPQQRPRFPELDTVEQRRPVVARLLPDRWVAGTWVSNEFRGYHESKPVDRDHPLVLAPQLVDIADGADARRFLGDQRLGWRFDYDTADAIGMAITIPLDRTTRRGFSDVIVMGLCDGDSEGDVTRLLEHHRFGSGLSFIAQGTPTNHTESVTEVPSVDPTIEFTREFPDSPIPSQTPLDLSKQPDELYRASAGLQLRTALGLSDGEVLDRTEGTDDLTADRSRAMQRVLWTSTVGHTLMQVLPGAQPLLAANDLAWLRDWFVAYVRGGAPLPTLRIAEQPYGVLPVTPMPDHVADPVPGDPVSALSNVIANVGLAWISSRHNVATVSPIFGDTPPGATAADEAVEVAGVLGAVPHPFEFRIREVHSDRSVIHGAWVDAANTMHTMFGNMPKPEGGYFTALERQQGLDLVWSAYQSEHDAIYDGGAGQQYWALGNLRSKLVNQRGFYPSQNNPVQAIIDHIDDVMRPMVAAHDLRAQMRRFSDRWSDASLPTHDDPDLWYSVFDETTDSDTQLVLIEASREWLVRFLNQQIRRVQGLETTGRVEPAATSPVSLFSTLVRLSVDTVHQRQAGELRLGLERLLALVEGDEVDDPIDELRRLVRETLGLATHRHDAWHTSVASARLAQVRSERPTGLRAGAYGWMIDIAPDSGQPDTHGFVHAPSIDHAATAGILRSAWEGLSGGTDAAPFAIDLSSDRVRRATWLLDGLRNGNDLGELLGQRFERRMHDLALDRHIDDVRRLVLDAAGQPNRPPNSIVDGLALTAAHAEGAGDELFDSLIALRNAAPNAQRPKIDQAFIETTRDLDAVTDLLMADSVHSLVKGNTDATAAALAVAGSEPGGLPQPRVADIDRSTTTITHRVAHGLSHEAGAGSDISAQVHPALAGEIRRLLPDLATLSVDITHVAASDGSRTQRTLDFADLGLTASLCVQLMPPRPDLATTPLIRYLTARVVRESGPGDVTVDLPDDTVDALVLAESLHEALGTARDLRPTDLPLDTASAVIDPAVTPLATIDVADLERRHRIAAARLDFLLDDPSESMVLDAATDLLAVAPLATITALAAPGDSTAASSLWRRVQARRDRLGPSERASDESATAHAKRLVDELDSVTDMVGPVVTNWTLTAIGRQLANLEDASTELGGDMRARTWLTGVSKVHGGVAAWQDALRCAESTRSTTLYATRLQQTDIGRDGWAAFEAPAPGIGSATCLVNTGIDIDAAGAISGVLIESWTESIPGRDVTTGVAVHFDSPSSRAPQTILLATAPPDESWDRDLLRDTLKQTLELAQQRAVGPETLSSHGQFIPALFLPDGINVASEPRTTRDGQRNGGDDG